MMLTVLWISINQLYGHMAIKLRHKPLDFQTWELNKLKFPHHLVIDYNECTFPSIKISID